MTKELKCAILYISELIHFIFKHRREAIIARGESPDEHDRANEEAKSNIRADFDAVNKAGGLDALRKKADQK